MKFKALALDFDGTIADERGLDPGVREAIARARRRGLVVLIVTGRILGDLRRVAGDLSFVDAVVAENGAVIAFPESGRSAVLHDPPRPQFLDELKRRGIEIGVGQVVVEAAAAAAQAAMETIRAQQQPLVLLFNRERMMILPQAVSKATGLIAALDALRLSSHNVLAIGDAENDHELLRSAEIGVAVEWGSHALRESADEVLKGSGPSAVAPYLDSLMGRANEGLGIPMRRPRRRLVLGTTTHDASISLAVTGRNVVVSGDPRSGKSWVGGLLCEQLILHGYSVVVIDPEGDYASLEALRGVVVVGGDDPPPKPHDLLRLLRHPDRSVVVELSQMPHGEKLAYLRELLPQIKLVRQRTGLPHRLLIDEAHYFLHETDVRAMIDLDSGGCTSVTYQASRLHPDVLRTAEIVLVSRATDPDEVRALAGVVGASAEADEWIRILADLGVDEVALLPGSAEAGGRLKRIRLVERLTPHVRHRTKYIDVPVAEHHAFSFSCHGKPTGDTARTLKEFVEILGRTAPECFDTHLLEGDFSRWIADVFGDRYLAGTLRHLEANYRLHRICDINDAIAQAIRTRYEFEPEEM